MGATFRASMTWLHSWAGVVLGGLLLAIFWTGTLAVFDYEIDRWMAPTTRLELPAKPASLETLRPFYEAAVAAKASNWFVVPPTERTPVFLIGWRHPSGSIIRLAHPETGAPLADPGTLAGSRFIYPFHYMLHIEPRQIGRWIVGLAAMAMLALLVSGVVVHRKVFADFFTFRAAAKPRRQILDLHNVTGVVALPFHIAITLSGLIFFYSTYFPSAWRVVFPDVQALYVDALGFYERQASNRPGALASLDDMAAKARHLWGRGEPRYLVVFNSGDAAAYVLFARSGEDSVEGTDDAAYFDAASGALLHQHSAGRPVLTAQRFIAGLHAVQFRHWTLRWLYFGLGLVSCVMIATGYLFWLESRRKKHAQLRLGGVRLVEGLTVGSVTGIVIATFSFFVVNRLLPLGTTFAGQDRAALEVWTFCLAWTAAFAHAWLRPDEAWMEQCAAIAMLAAAAVALNWLTTGDHLLHSLGHRHLWPVAGMDLLLLAGSAIAAVAAFRLHRRVRKMPS